MFSLLLKSILCSGILLLIYYAILSKEKIFQFNRFFLLFSVVISLVIPFVTIPWYSEKVVSNNIIVGELSSVNTQNTETLQNEMQGNPIILWIYLAISLLFVGKLIFSFWKLKNMKGELSNYQGEKILIIQEPLSVFSFWNTIYCSKNKWNFGNIDERILQHEIQHLKQKHSWDILFIEILKALFWCNPALYFYKKAMVANHEFLADEAIISHYKEINSYQHLILDEIQNKYPTTLTHSFNYYNIKKRFIMMTIKKGNFATSKQALAISLLTMLVVGLSEKSYAQKSSTEKNGTAKEVKANKKEAGQLQATSTFIPINEDTKKKNEEKSTVVATLVEGKSISSKENTVTDVAFASPVEEEVKPKYAAVATYVEDKTVSTDETPAEFPGGNNKFRAEVMKIFDTSKINIDKGLIKTEVFFTVTSEGKVKDFEAKGNTPVFNDEALRAIKTVAESAVWTPLKKNGVPQNFRYKMPITQLSENYIDKLNKK